MEELGGLESRGSQRVRHNRATNSQSHHISLRNNFTHFLKLLTLIKQILQYLFKKS